SPGETRYLSTLPLLGAPTVAAYSAENHSAYFAYASQVVRKMDLAAATPVEAPLFNLPAAPTGLTTAGQFIYAVANGIKTYSPAGTLLSNGENTYYAGNHNTWDPVNRRVYHFRDGVSPNDLHFDTLSAAGLITGGGETPYHGDFTPTKPIRVSPDGTQIVIGSGVVFTANGLTKISSLANGFTDAAWHGGRLVTVRLINGVSQLQTWNGAQFTVGADVRQVSGTPLRLLPLDAARLLLITQVEGIPRFTILNTALEPTYVSPAKPLPPSVLAVTGRSDSTVGLSWMDTSDNEDGFLVEYRTGTGAWLSGGTLPVNATSATVTGLASGTVHEFRVTAFSGDLNSAPSGSVTALTLTGPDQPAGEPYGLKVTRIFNDRITLEWRDNASNETAFVLLRSTTAAGATTSFTAAANATTYTITGLSPSTTYYFRVQVMNGSNAGDLSTQVSAATLSSNSIPAAPSKLTVASKTSNTVSLTWQDNSGNEDNFAIERSSSPATTWTTVATLGFNQTAYTDTTAVPNTAYSYRVRASNAAGNAVSSTVTV
ncbi:MAG: fibronectin type III domain-containing protein, partial [Alphaproteobacteria bacterium]